MKFDPFGRSRLWSVHKKRSLGDAEALQDVVTSEMIASSVPNRLAEVPVKTILARHRLRYRMFGDDAKVSMDTSWMATAEKAASENNQIYVFKDWTEDDFKALAAVANDPTEEELRDLAFIDGFWSNSPYYYLGEMVPSGSLFSGFGIVKLRDMCSGIPDIPLTEQQAIEQGGWGTPFNLIGQRRPPDPDTAAYAFAQKYAANPFFCGKADVMPVPRTLTPEVIQRGSGFLHVRVPSAIFPTGLTTYTRREAGYPEFFGIDVNLPWEEVKGQALRSVAMLDALVDYPFPPPIDIRPQYWYATFTEDMKNFLRQDIVVNRALARLWITVATVNKYNDIAAWIMHDIEKQARDDKRDKLIQTIALGATFAVITLGLGYALAPLLAPLATAGIPVTGSTVASAITSGVQQAMTAEQKKDAAKAMEDVAKLFAADAPAFSKEALAARDTFGYLGEALTELTEEQKAAIDQVKNSPEYSASEVGEQYDAEPSNWPLQKKLMIGGGIAAAGVAAILTIGLLRG